MIEEELIKTAATSLILALTVTTGGTGFSPADVTPEGTAGGLPEACSRDRRGDAL
jgi:molybdopterin biosynthesis enzyme MoaB